MVKKKALKKTEEYLKELKNKHSKMENISFNKLKFSTYLKNQNINVKEATLLFQFRTRMYQVTENFKTLYQNNPYCDLCKKELCSQKHLFSCKVLKSDLPELVTTTVKYEYIFGTNEQMSQVSKLLTKITKERSLLLEILNAKD